FWLQRLLQLVVDHVAHTNPRFLKLRHLSFKSMFVRIAEKPKCSNISAHLPSPYSLTPLISICSSSSLQRLRLKRDGDESRLRLGALARLSGLNFFGDCARLSAKSLSESSISSLSFPSSVSVHSTCMM